ncbi:hypothetical protein CXIVA_01270 [Clostridium sp. SY8519]|uniref:CDP-glycerol glycerophosphotransferase family protein n=1 Tax=Clostridium sp. (strain SY8519) TaxID=1042156 RepID=UPI000217152D|nr:CDP-glycerol glycerophosphotransferase family protein [Clostridium sp. SY8519]BAK46094.1 hypothetical protein CXIVA_01270 [Clostridium sp. SY8519]
MADAKETAREEKEAERSKARHLRKCRRIARFKPVQKNKIVFSQFGGKGYGCNPRAICDEFLKRGDAYDLVWILGKSQNRKDSRIPDRVRVVKDREAVYELLTAKVWINNIHFNKMYENGLVKRDKTIYLNTFHGGITLKSEGTDKNTYKEKAYEELSEKEKNYRTDADYVDYITCGGEVEKHVLEEFFYGKGEILELGDARTDILINGSPEAEQAIRATYQIPAGTKIAFFAPTFRNGMVLKWYNMDYVRVVEALEEMTGDPWVLLIRLHPRLISKAKKLIPKHEKIINASKYPDMQDIAVAADLMISDYSSAITDFMLTRKPAFMYVPDLEEYQEKRGMYYTMEQLPFPYAKTTDDLIAVMRQFDAEQYQKDIDKFLELIGYHADGQAAKRIVDFLISKME